MSTAGHPPGSPGDGATIGSYLATFTPGLSWTDLGSWPPDVFALANLALDATEAYRYVVAPPPGHRWPPTDDWNDRVVAAGRAWCETAGHADRPPPPAVQQEWDVVTAAMGTPLPALRAGQAPELCAALVTLHAMADEACSGLAAPGPARSGTFEHRAWEAMAHTGSLASIHPTRVHVTPKTHFAPRGMTIRSLSRYLALNYEPIDVQWHRIEIAPGRVADRRHFNLLLLPWPLHLESRAFRPMEGPITMERGTFGFFEFDPATPVDLELLAALVEAGQRTVRRIDAVVLPEGAVTPTEVAAIEEVLAERDVTFLIAGVRRAPAPDHFGGNHVHLAVRTATGWERYVQAKHHRWCLDGPQIRQYHLCRSLAPDRQWWEGIDLEQRAVHILDVGGGALTAPLICEDLARLDEVSDVLRRIGPSLVIALLLDGPQLAQRWPCRYASVLTDDPGSAVLTLSSLGMVTRSRPPGRPPSRAVALWNDPDTGIRQLDLARGASGLLIRTAVGSKTVWTADGRRHEGNTPSPVLVGVHQLRAPTGRADVAHRSAGRGVREPREVAGP